MEAILVSVELIGMLLVSSVSSTYIPNFIGAGMMVAGLWLVRKEGYLLGIGTDAIAADAHWK